jgi:hypothetical protein
MSAEIFMPCGSDNDVGEFAMFFSLVVQIATMQMFKSHWADDDAALSVAANGAVMYRRGDAGGCGAACPGRRLGRWQHGQVARGSREKRADRSSCCLRRAA